MLLNQPSAGLGVLGCPPGTYVAPWGLGTLGPWVLAPVWAVVSTTPHLRVIEGRSVVIFSLEAGGCCLYPGVVACYVMQLRARYACVLCVMLMSDVPA
ncbi:hypothetical protein GGS20DRAFT_539179 [Poronia punctata]|nr:hypothetical protein GGS20DRAFT_539179 [Poronia punctata]